MNEKQTETRPTAQTQVQERRPYSIDEIAEATARAVVPRHLDDVWDLAQRAAKSGLFGVRSSEDAFVRIVTGAELGISSYAALRCIAVVSGKPVLDATLIAGLCQRSRDCLRWSVLETTEQRCIIETQHRRDGVIKHAFTWKDAERAKLVGKDNWRNYPRAMLRARCISELARIAYPGVVAGIYTPEELERVEAPALTDTVASSLAQERREQVDAHEADIADLGSAIVEAETLDELNAVGERIRQAKLDGEPRALLREAFMARRKALTPAKRRRSKAEKEAPPAEPSSPEPSRPTPEPPAPEQGPEEEPERGDAWEPGCDDDGEVTT